MEGQLTGCAYVQYACSHHYHTHASSIGTGDTYETEFLPHNSKLFAGHITLKSETEKSFQMLMYICTYVRMYVCRWCYLCTPCAVLVCRTMSQMTRHLIKRCHSLLYNQRLIDFHFTYVKNFTNSLMMLSADCFHLGSEMSQSPVCM